MLWRLRRCLLFLQRLGAYHLDDFLGWLYFAGWLFWLEVPGDCLFTFVLNILPLARPRVQVLDQIVQTLVLWLLLLADGL